MTSEQGGAGEGGNPPAGRPAPAVARPFLGPTPRSGRAVTPAASSGRVTPPYLPRELSYTPSRLSAVPAPATEPLAEAPTSTTPPADSAPVAPVAPGSGRAAPEPAPETVGATAPLLDDDAWDWGGEAHLPAVDHPATDWVAALGARDPSAAETQHEPDWFQQPLAAAAASATSRAGERAAQALEVLAHQLRAGSLALDARAALDSDEAVLASVLAALFARRAR